MKYRTIVADPPWPLLNDGGTGVDVRNGGRVTHLPYKTMSLDDISALPIYDLTTNIDGDAHVYLWTTSRFLGAAFDVLAAWEFHYADTLVWCKPSRGWSVGGTYQNNVEFILHGRRPKRVARPEHLVITSRLAELVKALGLTKADVDKRMGTQRMAQVWWLSTDVNTCRVPSDKHWPKLKAILGVGSELDAEIERLNRPTESEITPQAVQTRWFTWPRGPHSAKPEAFLDLVEQVSPGPYLELFARRNRLGWDTWGDESLKHVEISGV